MSARVQPSAAFKGENLPPFHPSCSPLAPQRAQELQPALSRVPALRVPRSLRRPWCRLLGALDGGRGECGCLEGGFPERAAAPGYGGGAGRRAAGPPVFAVGPPRGGARARRTVAGGRAASVCGGCGEWVRACACAVCVRAPGERGGGGPCTLARRRPGRDCVLAPPELGFAGDPSLFSSRAGHHQGRRLGRLQLPPLAPSL